MLLSNRLQSLSVHLCLIWSFVTGELKRPRGVAISKASLYQPDNDFTCFDGSHSISFGRINDDYCDCEDGSDEPGTSACANGSFHCTNAGYKPKYIPSSRVNDGICDCCDGTDEYNRKVTCANYCRELGKAYQDEMEKKYILEMEGHEMYKEYAHKGQEAKKEKQARLQLIKAERDELQPRRIELEKLKNEAEIPEKAAKEKFQQDWEEEKARTQADADVNRSLEAFHDLDYDKDNVVEVEEMTYHREFDIDANGEVSKEEAKEYLEDHEQVDYELFFERIWPHIREIYRKPGEKQEDIPKPDEPTKIPDVEDHDELSEEDMDEDDHIPEQEMPEEEEDEKEEVEKMPEYDPDTKALIDAAAKARAEFDEADKHFNALDKEITELNKILDLDLGLNHEFYPLRGECYEYTDREYTYILCPFDKTTQKSKHGGMETTLGRWGHWSGGDDDRYSKQKYENGQMCWNGPDRTCELHIACGVKNELLGAREPNRCEYAFEFKTPAACHTPPSKDEEKDPLHDEL